MSKAIYKDAFIAVAPVTSKGKWAVYARRVGAKDRFALLAEVRTEEAADRIITALTAMQGEKQKLEAQVQPMLEDVRRQLAVARTQITQLNNDLSGSRSRLQTEQRDHDSARTKLRIAEADLGRVRTEFTVYREKNPEKASA